LIIAGFATHMCISATTRSALDHGYVSTVVAAACATRDLPDALGKGVVPAAEVQRATLAALADRFATIVPDAAALN
jgi:nicotinamidase-related amidase